MRSLLLVPVLAVSAWAENERRVAELVEELRAPLTQRRQAAYAKLAALGPKIVPLLQKVRTDDPEATRLLRALTRSARKLRLLVVASEPRVPLGSPLVLRITLANETRDRYQLPLVAPTPRGRAGGTKSAFHIRVGEGKPSYLTPDQVETVTPVEGQAPQVGAGSALVLTITLEGLRSPLRRPGKVDITVYYGARNARREGSVRATQLEAAPVTVEAYGRTPAVLEAALRGTDKKARLSAVRELEVRNDPAILPLLRAFAGDPDLRLAAITRLGENADTEDLRLIRKAVRDSDKEVRKAAVRALGNFRSSRARSALIRFADTGDVEMLGPAVEALVLHKRPETISCFIRLLRKYEKPWGQVVRDTLFDWTGVAIGSRLKDVESFEGWWLKNGEDWAARNRQDR